MIIVHGLGCGYDGGGMACGPMPGSVLVELKVVADELIHFVFVSQYECFEKVVVSKKQMFDTFIDLPYNDIDWEKQSEEAMRGAVEVYDYELGYEPDEMFESRFGKAIHLARLAMQEFQIRKDDEDYEYAAEFIEEYIGVDIDTINLPELDSYNDEEDEAED